MLLMRRSRSGVKVRIGLHMITTSREIVGYEMGSGHRRRCVGLSPSMCAECWMFSMILHQSKQSHCRLRPDRQAVPSTALLLINMLASLGHP